MACDGFFQSLRRVLLVGLAAVLVLVLGATIWFLTRRITPGDFSVRVAPAGPAGSFSLSLLGPGGGKLGDWRFVEVPTPSVLAGLDKKVPWTAVSTNAGPRRPCLTLQLAPGVPEAAVAPVERLALLRCCPGKADVASCPVRRVLLER
jgi:hypothetical protein